MVIDECLIFWKKARIPTKDKADCVKNFKKKYELWRNLEKSNHRENNSYNLKVEEFEDLDKLFNIAHSKALEIKKIEVDKALLISQRNPGRPVAC